MGKIIIMTGARLTRKKNKETGKYYFYSEYTSKKNEPVIRFSVVYPSGDMFPFEDFVLFGNQAKTFKQLVKDGRIVCDEEKNTVLYIYAREVSNTYADEDGGQKVSKSNIVQSFAVEKIAKRGEKSEKGDKNADNADDEYMQAGVDEYPLPEETKPKTVTPTKPGTAAKPKPAEPPKTAARPDTAAKPKTAARPGTAAKPKTAPRPSVNAVGNIVGKYLNGSGDDPFLSN